MSVCLNYVNYDDDYIQQHKVIKNAIYNNYNEERELLRRIQHMAFVCLCEYMYYISVTYIWEFMCSTVYAYVTESVLSDECKTCVCICIPCEWKTVKDLCVCVNIFIIIMLCLSAAYCVIYSTGHDSRCITVFWPF